MLLARYLFLAISYLVCGHSFRMISKTWNRQGKVSLRMTEESSEKRSNVVIFGASGRTGKLVVDNLLRKDNVNIVGVVRDSIKARRIFGNNANVSIEEYNLEFSKPSELLPIVKEADTVVICSSYLPSGVPDPLGPYKVDYLGTKAIVDACVDAKVSKCILLSSLLTNGLQAGQLLNPQFLLLNLFGAVLFQKRQAELYLQNQIGLNYTIIRPGGLRNEPPKYPVLFGSADTIFKGSISRKQVAEIIAEACFLPEAANKIVEVIASEDALSVSIAQGFTNVASSDPRPY